MCIHPMPTTTHICAMYTPHAYIRQVYTSPYNFLYFYYIIVFPIYTSYAYGHTMHLPYMRVISTRPIIPVFTFPMYIHIYSRV